MRPWRRTTVGILPGILLVIVCSEVWTREVPFLVAAEGDSERPGSGERAARNLYLKGLQQEAQADDEAGYAAAAELYWESAVAGSPLGMLEWGNALLSGQVVSRDDTEALDWYRNAAENGNAEAAMNLGWYYARTPGNAADAEKARRWYERADALGFPSARYAIRALELDREALSRRRERKDEDAGTARGAERLLQRVEELPGATDRNSESRPGLDQGEVDDVLAELRAAAESGDTNAMIDLGLIYSRGKLVNQDEKEAVRWWRLAADRGDAWGQHDLGWAYASGRGIDRDLKAAFHWFFRSADQGNARALWETGLAYLEGRGVKQNEADAAYCFRRAAERGDPQAMAAMGQLYLNGSRSAGIDRDVDVACDWYLMAAAHGEKHSESAARSIAMRPESSFSRAMQGERRPSQEAITRKNEPQESAKDRFADLEHRADGGDVRAKIQVAAAQWEGKGTARNPQSAIEVFRRYAATEPDARAYLAECLAEGDGIRPDRARAAELLESAAASGSAEAMYRIGRQSLRGSYLNETEGLTLLQKAAAKGNGKAMYELGQCWRQGRGVPRDERQAVAWFLQAGYSGSAEGALETAKAFDIGNQVRQSPARALAWYREASRLGIQSAETRANAIVAESEDVGAARASIALAEIRAGRILTDDVPASPSDHALADLPDRPSNGEAEFRLGKAYREGRGVVQEPALASFWLTRAAGKGHMEAHVTLGALYEAGVGVPQDKGRAQRLFKVAVDGGSAAGMYELATLYSGQDPDFRDRRQALKLFLAAAEGGSIPAQRFLGKSSRYGLATIVDGGEANRWWRQAAENGDGASLNSLGELWEEGFGVPRDLEQSAVWYKRAVKSGIADAKTPLLRVQGQLRASSF